MGIEFTDGEIDILAYIVQNILHGALPTQAQRHREFAALARKIIAAKEQRKAEVAESNGS